MMILWVAFLLSVGFAALMMLVANTLTALSGWAEGKR